MVCDAGHHPRRGGRDGHEARAVKAAVVAVIVVAGLCAPRPAAAYSVLAHEANIDALWDGTIAPMLRARSPGRAAKKSWRLARYAYGGCVIQDLGYYPFGSHFFSNLLHYVRTGDFVEALIRDAQDVNEYAFALGALGHYAADNEGHRLAVNRVVALMYPKLKAKFGNQITYAQSRKSHVMVEFSFDVVQVAASAYAPEAYHQLHRVQGGQAGSRARVRRDVRHPDEGDLLQRGSRDLHIPSRRGDHHSGDDEGGLEQESRRDQESDSRRAAETFVFALGRQQYEKEFGADYAKPRGFARVLGWIYALIPKIGPFRPLAFTVPTPEAERLFLDSFTTTRQQFRVSLDALAAGRLRLVNTDFDTGQPTKRGEYSLADDTYDELLGKLADRAFADVPDSLRSNLVAYYGDVKLLPAGTRDQQKRLVKIRQAARPARTGRLSVTA